MPHKSGFVNIIGNPNVGKSTLMNALVGEKLSIITPKAQTTRHRIMGIVNGEGFQIVYSDTPGIVKPAYGLHQGMLSFVNAAIEDADLILFMVEAEDHRVKNKAMFTAIRETETPVLLVLNKIDLLDQEKLEAEFDYWKEQLPNSTILPVSALHKANLDQVLKHILEKLPEAPPYFPKDELTDKPLRFFVSEIIREKLFMNFKQEVPYSCEVEIEYFHEKSKPPKMGAVIYVERDSQKGIIIGKGGTQLKKIGTQARKDIEAFMGQHVFLELFVKVSKDWKNKPRELRRFGYLA